MDAALIDKFKTKLLLRRQELLIWVNHWEHDLLMSKEQVSESLEKAKVESSTLLNLKMDERYEKELEEIDQALGRIEGGTFGFCRICGRQILLSRLETIPETTLCRECALNLEIGK